MSQSIAFIGVGNMGCPMAENLMKAGKSIKVFDKFRIKNKDENDSSPCLNIAILLKRYLS